MHKQEFLYRGPNHAANLNDMRLKDKYCDVTVKVDGKEIRAHKVILAANLKYFETMFSSDSFQESQDGVITMESVKKADLELFVSYAYTGAILLTDSNALNLLELANYLSEDGIKEACVEFLEQHLKEEEACRAYKFANTIECTSLKNAAKAKIIKNFSGCSKSADFLNLDAESLMNILTDGKTQSIQLQKMLFDGVMRWTMHDAKERNICLEDLLSSIDVTKLKGDDVTNCLYKYVLSHNDQYGITKNVIIYYEASKIQRNKQEQVLIVGRPDSCQFYDFMEKKWSLQLKIPSPVRNSCECSAVLNDKLYYISNGFGDNHLYMFDPSSKQVTTLQSPTRILDYAALCACSRFLYICGGVQNDSMSDQIVRFDPQTNSFDTLTPMGTKRRSAAAIFYQDCLHVLGGFDGSSDLQLVEKYDPIRNEWTVSLPMREKRRAPAVTILDGKLYACGGFDNNSSVEVYDPATNSWKLVASMNKPRGYFLVVTHKDNLLAIGGSGEKTIEVYDPSKNQWLIDHKMSSGLQKSYGVGGLVSSSCITNT